MNGESDVKIKRQKLIDLLKVEIHRREVAAKEQHEKSVTRQREDTNAYVRRTADAWQTFARSITVAVGGREPVTWDDVPHELRSYRDGYVEVHRPRPVDANVDDADQLRALLAVLEATEDEVISTYALEKMGFVLGRTLRGVRSDA